MKWTDIILIGGALIGGYFISQALNPKKQESGFLSGDQIGDVIRSGGTVTTTHYKEPNTAGIALGSFLGLPGIAYALLEGQKTVSSTQMIDGDGSTQTKTNTGLKTGGNTTMLRPKGYYRTSPGKTIDKIKDAVSPKANVNVAAKIIKDIPQTITEEPGVFQPETVARLVSRAKYGTFGGR